MDKFPDNPYAEGGYVKLKAGENTFRLFEMIDGWEYWTDANGNVVPRGKQAGKGGKPNRVGIDELNQLEPNARKAAQYFRAYSVWNYDADRMQVLQVKQRQIIEPLIDYTHNDKWGDPTKAGYDVVVTRKGEGLDTKYSVVANPKEKFSWTGKEKVSINLNALFTGDDPFEEGDNIDLDDVASKVK